VVPSSGIPSHSIPHFSPLEFSIAPSENSEDSEKNSCFSMNLLCYYPPAVKSRNEQQVALAHQSDYIYYSSLTSWQKRLRLKIRFSLLQNVIHEDFMSIEYCQNTHTLPRSFALNWLLRLLISKAFSKADDFCR
jgi:hypothetical protein